MKRIITAVLLSLAVFSTTAIAKPQPLTPFSDANILNVAYGELDGCSKVYVKDVVSNNVKDVKWETVKENGAVYVTVFGDEDVNKNKSEPQRIIYLFEVVNGEQFRLASTRYIGLIGDHFDSGWSDEDVAASVFDSNCAQIKQTRS